jgi:hypothetical protein
LLRTAVQLRRAGWEMVYDETSRKNYYFHAQSQTSQWERPQLREHE